MSSRAPLDLDPAEPEHGPPRPPPGWFPQGPRPVKGDERVAPYGLALAFPSLLDAALHLRAAARN